MSPPFTLCPLHDLPDEQIHPLLIASETEGFKFVRRVVEEWQSGANRFSGKGEALLGAFVDGHLVAICGLMSDPYAKQPEIGRLRNLYVLPSHRGHGIGGDLTRRVIALAAEAFVVLRLRAGTPQAARLYEHVGFRPVADLADCTHVLAWPSASNELARRSSFPS